MKALIISVTLSLVILTSLLIIACTSSNKQSVTENVIMRDITDPQMAQPKLEEITPMYDLNNSPWNGASFRFVDITNVSYNHVFEASIEAENQWMGNEFDRAKKVKNFYNNISQILNDANKEPMGKDNSSIYIPIAHELNRLSQSTSQKKSALIYSDLMENTVELSFYNKQKFNLLKSKPELIRKYLETLVPLKNLKGIKIYLIYQPSNVGEDEAYKVVSRFYKDYFESKGAKVEIGANLN